MEKLLQELADKIMNCGMPESYCTGYVRLFGAYSDAVVLLDSLSERASEIFRKWFQEKGLPELDFVVSHIIPGNADSRLNAFSELYMIYFGNAILHKDAHVLLDLLYTFPGRMKEDFSALGFIAP